nr:hypothetical protein Iba_chr14cCG3890 [Ipomoea batatas]
MSSPVIIGEGLTRMWLEDDFSLSWLSTSSIPIATQVDVINRVYKEKVASLVDEVVRTSVAEVELSTAQSIVLELDRWGFVYEQSSTGGEEREASRDAIHDDFVPPSFDKRKTPP